MDLGGISLSTVLLYMFLAAVGLVVQALVLIGFGLLAGAAPVALRFILWPIALALVIGFIPGLFVALLFFGFLTPTFSGHTLPRTEQPWPQRGLNDLLMLVAKPWQPATT